MNSEKVQTIITEIVSELHNRIGGKAARKQYPPAKHQIETLTQLGILELMPKGFGHSDAKAVIEAAQTGGKMVGGFNADGEGDVTTSKASKLYQAIHEVEVAPVVTETIESNQFIISEIDNEIAINDETYVVKVESDGTVTVEIDGGYGLADFDDGSQGYVEIDGNYRLATYDNVKMSDSYDSPFLVTITPEMIADAKAYRANYPIEID